MGSVPHFIRTLAKWGTGTKTQDSIDVSMLEVLGQKTGLFDLYARDSEVASIALNQQEELKEATIKQMVLKLEREQLEN